MALSSTKKVALSTTVPLLFLGSIVVLGIVWANVWPSIFKFFNTLAGTPTRISSGSEPKYWDTFIFHLLMIGVPTTLSAEIAKIHFQRLASNQNVKLSLILVSLSFAFVAYNIVMSDVVSPAVWVSNAIKALMAVGLVIELFGFFSVGHRFRDVDRSVRTVK